MTEGELRRAAILSLARQRGRVCMGDVRGILPYWHPETLRLDLARLAYEGALRPQGRRRWRVYVATAPEPWYTNGYMMG